MDITLYHAPSTAALVVHWLLVELDWPHQVRTLDLAYLKLNPAAWSRPW